VQTVTTLNQYGKNFGRPTKYRDNMVDKAYEYINGGYQDHDHVIPSVVGLALALGITSTTCYEWAKLYPDFSFMLRTLMDAQQEVCISGGMSGRFNSTITKLVLSKHGYSDRVEQVIDHISSDASIKPAIFQGVSKDITPPAKMDDPTTGMLQDKPPSLRSRVAKVAIEQPAFKQSTVKRGRPPVSEVDTTGALASRRRQRTNIK
jgi:hypothetical protein